MFIEARPLAHIPAVVRYVGARSEAVERGTVLVLHGLGASKEVQAPEAELFAREGYLSIALDAVGHGDRRFPDFEHRFSFGRAESSMKQVVEATSEQLQSLLGALKNDELAVPGRVGAVGISMGGAIVLAALACGCPLDAAVTIVAPVKYTRPHELKRMPRSALVFQAAEQDEVVAMDEVRTFVDELTRLYQRGGQSLRFRYLEHGGEGHFMSENAWGSVLRVTTLWLRQHLRRTPP